MAVVAIAWSYWVAQHALGDEPSKFRRVVNDHLLCLKCMCEVVRFENVVWTKDADYIFFRNFWPDGDRLCEKMKPQKDLPLLLPMLLGKRRRGSAY